VHIVTTIVHMETALTAADAPQRQTNGVAEWGRWVADAVVAGYACGSTTGTTANPAWSGEITHRGFIATCQAILQALRSQQAAAERLRAAAEAQAEQAKTRRALNAAIERARRASEWASKAMLAETAGVGLVAAEDAILRPVGEAVTAAGGIHEVAQHKHYHQGSGRR
jgi:hypothetical protein